MEGQFIIHYQCRKCKESSFVRSFFDIENKIEIPGQLKCSSCQHREALLSCNKDFVLEFKCSCNKLSKVPFTKPVDFDYEDESNKFFFKMPQEFECNYCGKISLLKTL